MSRRYTVAEFEAAVARVREVWPRAAITTDIIVGFPGESDADFEETLATCRRVGFSRIHVFRYSPRAGTPAASLAQVDPRVIADRADRLRTLADTLAAEYARTHEGTEMEVVVERTVGGIGHFTSREYLHFSAPVEVLVEFAGTLVEGAIVRVPYDVLSGNTVGLE